MTAPTPGPWRDDTDCPGAVIAPDGSQIVAVMPRNRDANSRLIAAAPDLLAALKAMVAIVDERKPDRGMTVLNAARAAIKRAEGR